MFEVEKHSQYHVYYPDGYQLWIEDRNYFIELANSVPPFMLIPFLLRSNIKRLNRNSMTPEQIRLLSKLNHAKFYMDKNVNTLFLGDKYSDLRLMSQSATPQAVFCLLKIEGDIGKALRGGVAAESILSHRPHRLQGLRRCEKSSS